MSHCVPSIGFADVAVHANLVRGPVRADEPVAAVAPGIVLVSPTALLVERDARTTIYGTRIARLLRWPGNTRAGSI